MDIGKAIIVQCGGEGVLTYIFDEGSIGFERSDAAAKMTANGEGDESRTLRLEAGCLRC